MNTLKQNLGKYRMYREILYEKKDLKHLDIEVYGKKDLI